MIHVWPDSGVMALQAFGWGLLHFVWQGSLLALALAVFLRLARTASAQTRYVVSGCIFAAMLLCLPVTAAFSFYAVMPRFAVMHSGFVSVTVHPLPIGRTWMLWQSIKSGSVVLAEQSLRMCVWIWAIGSVLLLVRLAVAVAGVRRLRRSAVSLTPKSFSAEMAACIQRVDSLGFLQVLCSREVSAPAVIGWRRPALLLPEDCALSNEEFEAVLAHEIAHVRRHDYVVHLLQSVGEALLFFHPAMWWVSRKIAEEREHCCDDAAIAACGSPLTYARALSRLEEGRREFRTGFQLSANGGQLTMRINRILHPRDRQPGSRRRIVVSGFTVATLTVCGLLFGSQIAVRQTSAYAAMYSLQETATAASASSRSAQPISKEPDLACTYYDAKTIAHDGACDVNHVAGKDYTCIRLDDKSQVQRQIGCEWKVQRWQAWKQAQALKP